MTHTTNETLTSTTITLAGRDWEVVTFKNGRTEVYRAYEDEDVRGLPQFLGYYDDLCVSEPKVAEQVHRVVVEHLAAHRDYWSTYLPGAANWLAA